MIPNIDKVTPLVISAHMEHFDILEYLLNLHFQFLN